MVATAKKHEVKFFVDSGPDHLSPMARKFVNLMMENEDRSPDQCATLAGYKGGRSKANQLMRNPKIKHELLKLTEARNYRCSMNADKLLLKLVRVMEVCMQEVPYRDMNGAEVVKEDGTPVTDMVDKRGAIIAATQIGKHVDVQAWREPDQNLNVQHNHGGIDITKLNEDECRALMAIVIKARADEEGDDAPRRIESTIINQDGTDAK